MDPKSDGSEIFIFKSNFKSNEIRQILSISTKFCPRFCPRGA